MVRPALGSRVGLAVERLGSPHSLVQLGARRPMTPASLVKLLTATAALQVLGPQHRFTTTVVRGATPSDVVLVGGGDPLLSATPPVRTVPGTYPQPASLTVLARRTCAVLHERGIHHVRLRYDASLFTGPAVNPAWRKSYITTDVVSPISSLWVDEGRRHPGGTTRVADPAAEAAARFADLLRAHGCRVARFVGPTTAARGAVALARVTSAPLDQIVQHIIELSDNEGAEVLLRQVAIATGRPGSSREGVRAVKATLRSLGIRLRGVRLLDGSGLARSDAVPLRTLLDVLQRDADPASPQLSPLAAALPAAGFRGTLADRFTSDAPQALGVVRAKTGTLAGVDGLAGYLAPPHGVPLVFAAVADSVPARRTVAAQSWLDRLVARLVGCGCQRR
jgi:D-alanyl-D-alanine carboxypeptidase/D-alanyl-D-alanine-endopeptidase (penicillin-binding protein 4)